MCLTVLLFKVLSVKMFSLIVFLEELQVIFQLLEVFSKFFQTPDFFFLKVLLAKQALSPLMI